MSYLRVLKNFQLSHLEDYIKRFPFSTGRNGLGYKNLWSWSLSQESHGCRNGAIRSIEGFCNYSNI